MLIAEILFLIYVIKGETLFVKPFKKMIQDNIKKIKENIVLSCQKIDRDPKDITLVAITKTATMEEIKQVLDLGLFDIGENKIQEAVLKFSRLSTVKWHMVGHLQTNKVKEAVKIFDLIHSVDSIRVAEEIDKQASNINKIQDILVQVNASVEASKFGIKPQEAIEIIKEIAKLKNLNIKGLMTIVPIVDNPEQVRPYCRMLRELKDRINQLILRQAQDTSLKDTEQSRSANNQLTILSMGMTDDYQVAIEEGATMIRLGRAIFGH